MRNFLLVAADLANAVFAVIGAAYITNTQIVWWHFLIGAVCAMLPDVDAIPELIKRGKVGASAEYPYDHRSGIHFPIIFIIAGLIFVAYAPYWGWVFLLGTMLHFVNDLYGTGWGVPIFWPFINARFKLFTRKANQSEDNLRTSGEWKQVSDDDKKWRPIVVWRAQELHSYIIKYGVSNWQDSYSKKIDRIAIIEYLIALLAITALILFFVL